MKSELVETQGVHVLKIIGNIEFFDAEKLSEQLNEINIKHAKIILNLARVDFIDSSGLGTLINAFNELKRKKGIIKLVNVNDSILQTLELTKLINIFDIHESVEAGVKSFQ